MTNHLKYEKSPYLLQHAENPVDWYPWCDEAFDLAARRDVPVLLSIGYSTCHWCHVMARESFADEEVAAVLNERFVAVKVDREERPDIDSVYMSVCQAMTGSGGWPLTIFMTPDKQPFFAGTYFPKESRPGNPGFLRLLSAIAEKWEKDRSGLLAQSSYVVSFLKKQAEEDECFGGSVTAPDTLIEEGLSYFSRTFDKKNGGFGFRPKFPAAHNLLFLMAQKGPKAEKYLSMAERTLDQMYRGGIFDHIGGGFCRYATDEAWLVPHFEKMLYDNALLLLAYSQGFTETENPLYRAVSEKIAAYISRELTDPKGGFYCGQDADSDGIEGKYYVFTPEEIRTLLHLDPASAFCTAYDITPGGNFEGKSIPNLLKNDDYQKLPDEELLHILAGYRLERTTLHRDDKILTAWNGLMIAALAKSSRQLKKADFLESAISAADFLWENLQDDGRLFARWRQGHQNFAGTLDDYAFYIWGLLECYGTTFHPLYLQRADCLGKTMVTLFFDENQGGCYLYAEDSEQLFIRPKETYDGALPSGNAAALLIMEKLAFFTGTDFWADTAAKQRDFMAKICSKEAAGHGFSLWVLTEEENDRGQLICTMATEEALTPETLCTLWDLDVDILLKTPETSALLEEIAPFTAFYPIQKEGTNYYYCKNHICNPPVHTLRALENLFYR